MFLQFGRTTSRQLFRISLRCLAPICRQKGFIEPKQYCNVAKISQQSLTGHVQDQNLQPTPPAQMVLENNSIDRIGNLLVVMKTDSANIINEDVVLILERILEMEKKNEIDFIKEISDGNYTYLHKILNGNFTHWYPPLLPKLFEILTSLFGNDHPYVQNVERAITWYTKCGSINVVLSLLQQTRKYECSGIELKDKLLTVCTENLLTINSPKSFNFAFEMADILPKSLLSDLDKHISRMSDGFNAKILVNTLNVYADNNRRSLNVISRLCYNLSQQTEMLAPFNIIRIMKIFKSISFLNLLLLDKLSNDFCYCIKDIKRPRYITSMIFYIGSLQCRKLDLLDCLSKWIEQNIDRTNINDLVMLVRTLAQISHHPINSDTLVKSILPEVTQESVPDKEVWLDFIWSLTLLGWVSNNQLKSVLQSNFIDDLPSDEPLVQNKNLKKLCNIKAYALSLPDYDGPSIELLNNLIILQKKRKIEYKNFVINLLQNLFATPNYLKTNITTRMGFMIDGESVIGKASKPLLVSDYTTNFGEHKPKKKLPIGACNIAVLVWDYYDYTTYNKELTGPNKFTLQLLKNVGYKCLEISYDELDIRQTEINNTTYLNKKIKALITNSKVS